MNLFVLLLVLVSLAAHLCSAAEWQYCTPIHSCWPTVQDITEFNSTLDGEIVTAFNPLYKENVIMYNTRVTKYPYLMVFVESTLDVKKAVLFARKHNLQITVKSSGHDYIGRSTADLSIQIITKRMKGRHVILNSTRNTEGEITAETGNTWIEVYKEVEKYNRIVVGGAAHTVALGGYTLGGGHSYVGRKYGLAIDNLLQVEMVTANGSIVISNDHSTLMHDVNGHIHLTTNADLFWALRGGGGGTFGIVTKFTFKLHHAPKQFTTMSCFRPILNGTTNVGYEFMHDINHLLGSSLPAEWGGYEVFSGYKLPQLPSTTGSILIYMNHAGEYGSPTFNTILPFYNKYQDYCKFKNFSKYLDMANSTDPLYYHTVVFNTLMQPNSFTDAYYNFVFNASLQYPANNRDGAFGCTGTMIGGNMQYGVPDKTAVSRYFRTGSLSLTCFISWHNTSLEDHYVRIAEDLTKKLAKFGRGTYLNEASPFVPDWKTAYWAGHYDKLLRIKQAWDPDNIFTCYHCVGSDLKRQSTNVGTLIGRR